MTRLLASICLLGASLLSGCSSAQSPVAPSRKPQPVPEQARATSPAPTSGEVPAEVVEKLKADLASQKGVSASAVKVISAQSVMWPNGALGCARPGEMATQAIVPGYRVELEADGRRYAYHAAERGHFRLCENTSGRPLGREAIR